MASKCLIPVKITSNHVKFYRVLYTRIMRIEIISIRQAYKHRLTTQLYGTIKLNL